MQKFSFEQLPLKGAFLIKPFFSDDLRGSFIKDFSLETFTMHHKEACVW